MSLEMGRAGLGADVLWVREEEGRGKGEQTGDTKLFLDNINTLPVLLVDLFVGGECFHPA